MQSELSSPRARASVCSAGAGSVEREGHPKKQLEERKLAGTAIAAACSASAAPVLTNTAAVKQVLASDVVIMSPTAKRGAATATLGAHTTDTLAGWGTLFVGRAAWLWLRQPHGRFAMRPPLDLLKAGQRDAVIQAAERDFV